MGVGAIVGPILGAATGALISSTLAPSGGTVTSVAREPAEIERARSAAISALRPVLEELLARPEAVLKYTGISRLVPALTEAQRTIIGEAERLVGKPVTELEEKIATAVLPYLFVRPSDFLLTPIAENLREQMINRLTGQTRELIRQQPTTERQTRRIETRAAERVLPILQTLIGYQQLGDLVSALAISPTIEQTRAQVADLLRNIGGATGLLTRYSALAPIIAIPREQERLERAALEDLKTKIIETAMGALRTSPVSQVTTTTTSVPFGTTFWPSFASGIGTGIGQWLQQQIPTWFGATTTSPSFSTTSFGLGIQYPSWTGLTSPTFSRYEGFTLGARLPSFATTSGFASYNWPY